MTPIEMPGITLHFLIQKWNKELAGGYIQQMRAVHEDTFLIKIHTKKGNSDVLVALPHLILVSQRKWESMDEQPPIVNATKKVLDNMYIQRVEQMGQDRILVLHGEKANIIFELFGGGNVIITNEDNVILFVHHAKEWKGRTLKMREKYLPPQNELKNNSTFDVEAKMKPAGFELADAKNRQRLLPVFDTKIEKQKLETIFEIIEEKIVEEWKKPKVDSKLEAQKEALRVNAERQRELLKEWENKIDTQQRAGEWVYSHFNEVQLLLDAIQRGIKQKVSEKKLNEELQKKMPALKKVNVEKGSVEIETTEK